MWLLSCKFYWLTWLSYRFFFCFILKYSGEEEKATTHYSTQTWWLKWPTWQTFSKWLLVSIFHRLFLCNGANFKLRIWATFPSLNSRLFDHIRIFDSIKFFTKMPNVKSRSYEQKMLIFVVSKQIVSLSAFKKKIGFTGQFLVEPKPKEPTRHQYDYGKLRVCLMIWRYKCFLSIISSVNLHFMLLYFQMRWRSLVF